MYRHPIGKLSKGAVLDIGLKCPHSCAFCYYSYLNGEDEQFYGIRHSSFRTPQECTAILDLLKQSKFLNFDITGGEPVVHPGIVEIVQHSTELSLASRLITLGQFLFVDNLIDRLLDAGLTNFLFSVHSPNNKTAQSLTGAKLTKILEAFDFLDALDFSYCTNTVITDFNFKDLPALASLFTQHNVYHSSFIYMNPHYGWQDLSRTDTLFKLLARHSDIQPFIVEAVQILEASKIAVNLRYAPMCTVKGVEKNMVGVVGVRYDPYEWMNQGGHLGGDPTSCATPNRIVEGDVEPNFRLERFSAPIQFLDFAVIGRRSDLRYFPLQCGECGMIEVCDGVHGRYLQKFGAAEFSPFPERELGFPIHAARAQYLPPFIVKTEQFENMKALLTAEFDECTLESP